MRSVLWLMGLPVSWAVARSGLMRHARINADFYGAASNEAAPLSS